MKSRFKSVVTAMTALGCLGSAGAALAIGPGIYTHPLPRAHSTAECMRRAYAVVTANPNMELVSGSASILLQSHQLDVSYNIRCDMNGITMFVVAGRNVDLAEHMGRLHRAYQAD